MSDAARAARAFRRLEDQVRRGIEAALPATASARIEPALRAGTGAVRRALATPWYLRQQVATWQGTRDGQPVCIATWGKRDAPRLLFQILFDPFDESDAAGPRATWHGSRWFAPRVFDPRDADAWIVETTPSLAAPLRRAGFAIVPALVRHAASTETMRAMLERPSDSLGSDLRRIEARALSLRTLDYSAERSRTFYDRYLTAYAEQRFAGREEPTSFDEIDRLFAAGCALAVERPGSPEPDALALLERRGGTLYVAKLGVRDGDVALARDGALSAIYLGAVRHAEAHGLRSIDVGRSLPWRASGVGRYKEKWGLRPVEDPTQTFEYGVRVSDPDGPTARRLAEQQLILREPEGLRVWTGEGVKPFDEPSCAGGGASPR